MNLPEMLHSQLREREREVYFKSLRFSGVLLPGGCAKSMQSMTQQVWWQVGDMIDMHTYPGPGSPSPTATRAAVLGEYGGLGKRTEVRPVFDVGYDCVCVGGGGGLG